MVDKACEDLVVEMDSMSLGEPSAGMVLEYIEQNCYNQREVALVIGIHESLLSRWLNRKIAHYVKKDDQMVATKLTRAIQKWWQTDGHAWYKARTKVLAMREYKANNEPKAAGSKLIKIPKEDLPTSGYIAIWTSGDLLTWMSFLDKDFPTQDKLAEEMFRVSREVFAGASANTTMILQARVADPILVKKMLKNKYPQHVFHKNHHFLVEYLADLLESNMCTTEYDNACMVAKNGKAI